MLPYFDWIGSVKKKRKKIFSVFIHKKKKKEGAIWEKKKVSDGYE